MKKLIDESWLDEKIDEMEEIEVNSSNIAYKNEARIIKLALKGVKNKLQSPVEEIKSAIKYGLNSFEDFDRTSNYDEESRKEGLEEIQNEYLKQKGYEYNTEV